jgi:hypothetical protein
MAKRKCGRYKPGDEVHVSLRIEKKIGSDVYHHFDGIVEICRNGVYKVRDLNKDDYAFAYASELMKIKR